METKKKKKSCSKTSRHCSPVITAFMGKKVFRMESLELRDVKNCRQKSFLFDGFSNDALNRFGLTRVSCHKDGWEIELEVKRSRSSVGGKAAKWEKERRTHARQSRNFGQQPATWFKRALKRKSIVKPSKQPEKRKRKEIPVMLSGQKEKLSSILLLMFWLSVEPFSSFWRRKAGKAKYWRHDPVSAKSHTKKTFRQTKAANKKKLARERRTWALNEVISIEVAARSAQQRLKCSSPLHTLTAKPPDGGMTNFSCNQGLVKLLNRFMM